MKNTSVQRKSWTFSRNEGSQSFKTDERRATTRQQQIWGIHETKGRQEWNVVIVSVVVSPWGGGGGGEEQLAGSAAQQGHQGQEWTAGDIRDFLQHYDSILILYHLKPIKSLVAGFLEFYNFDNYLINFSMGLLKINKDEITLF